MLQHGLTRRMGIVNGVTAALTLTVAVVAFNFFSSEKRIEHRISREYSINDPRFAAERGVLLGPPFLDGNAYTALQNGDQIFPKMLSAIRGTQQSITFETYIYWSGDI